MKLKPDCVRDILLYLEENLKVELHNHNFNKISLKQLRDDESLRDKYTEEDIWYTIYNLKEIRFIEGDIKDVAISKMFFCDITNITWSGHQFLNTIRPDTIWKATKKGASKIGIMSIHALSTISMEVAKAVITNPIMIQSILDSIK